MFCWVPCHMDIKSNELADSASKSAFAPPISAVPLSDVTCFIRKHNNKMWQQLWDLQEQNKLHSLNPLLLRWPGVPVLRKDVLLARLRIRQPYAVLSPYVWRSMAKFGSCANKSQTNQPYSTHAVYS
ncbi:hypothetical protein AVEN_254233-1 [Araneus ventricosus]|uniref:Uncharacterized protein n=1 Tax=Araneus ventricosus TaxID=182803 RepID=A0A4Y2PCC5_ARAVE|nr:hypothetical protein AVEN_254233-1 [Araneus ventricosus]